MMTREEVLEAMKRPETANRLRCYETTVSLSDYKDLHPLRFEPTDWSMAEEPKPDPTHHYRFSRDYTGPECGSKTGLWVQNWENVDCPACLALKPKPEPVMGPLGPEDVPPGSLLRGHWHKYEWESILAVLDEGIKTINGGLLTWEILNLNGYTISRDGGKTWSRCEKEKP